MENNIENKAASLFEIINASAKWKCIIRQIEGTKFYRIKIDEKGYLQNKGGKIKFTKWPYSTYSKWIIEQVSFKEPND